MTSEFERIDFHDWRLFEFTVRTIALADRRFGNEVKLRIRTDERIPPTPPREIEVTFHNVRGLRAFLDFAWKTGCYDTISENLELPKEQRPDFPKQVRAAETDHRYLLVLTPPSGEIEVVAEGVRVQDLTEPSS